MYSEAGSLRPELGILFSNFVISNQSKGEYRYPTCRNDCDIVGYASVATVWSADAVDLHVTPWKRTSRKRRNCSWSDTYFLLQGPPCLPPCQAPPRQQNYSPCSSHSLKV